MVLATGSASEQGTECTVVSVLASTVPVGCSSVMSVVSVVCSSVASEKLASAKVPLSERDSAEPEPTVVEEDQADPAYPRLRQSCAFASDVAESLDHRHPVQFLLLLLEKSDRHLMTDIATR